MRDTPAFTVGASCRERTEQLRSSLLGLFGPESRAATLALWSFETHEWERNLRWLDTSGMALYVLARMQEIGIERLLPPSMLVRLERNAEENRARTASLLLEMEQLIEEFRGAGIVFAFLKGLTLVPESVPDPVQRNQLDLDLVADWSHVAALRTILEARGFHLHAAGGGTWEFKTHADRMPSIRQLYQVRPQRTIEVHWVRGNGNGEPQRGSVWAGQLARAEVKITSGMPVPSLCESDIFLNQALHLLGHLRGEHTRASWMLEFARHIETRANDPSFWERLESAGEGVNCAALACGVSFTLTQRVFGVQAPASVAAWALKPLPARVSLWTQVYGMRIATSDVPGSKLYLMLEAELRQCGAVPATEHKRGPIPMRVPPMISRGVAGEGLASRARRIWDQFRFVWFRLRFHIGEAISYWIELRRWGKLTGAKRSG